MQKKHIKNPFPKKYNDQQLREHIVSQVDNLQFNQHCQQVADNLKIDVIIVKELLLENSFTVLSLIQKNVLKDKEVKINITGYFSFITTLLRYKVRHLFQITKGRTY
jgi:hypothetical protein